MATPARAEGTVLGGPRDLPPPHPRESKGLRRPEPPQGSAGNYSKPPGGYQEATTKGQCRFKQFSAALDSFQQF
eukprot:3607203-Alexandrium_andersonii.AAC.1